MQDRPATWQIHRGLRVAAYWVLGILWLALVFAGLAIAFTPNNHSPALGWVLLVIAAITLILTADKWAQAFPGILAYGVIAGIIMIATGHYINNPQLAITRTQAIIMTLLFAASAAISFTFTKHALKVHQRLALFGFIVCFFWQAIRPAHMLLILTIGFALLLVAMIYDRVRSRAQTEAAGDG